MGFHLNAKCESLSLQVCGAGKHDQFAQAANQKVAALEGRRSRICEDDTGLVVVSQTANCFSVYLLFIYLIIWCTLARPKQVPMCSLKKSNLNLNLKANNMVVVDPFLYFPLVHFSSPWPAEGKTKWFSSFYPAQAKFTSYFCTISFPLTKSDAALKNVPWNWATETQPQPSSGLGLFFLSLYAAGASDSAHVRLLCVPQYTQEILGRRWIHRGDPDEAGSMIKGSLVPVKVPRCSRWNAGIAFRAIVMSSWKENSSSLRGQFDWQNKRKPPPHSPPPQKKNNGPVKNKTALM